MQIVTKKNEKSNRMQL